MFDDAVSWLKAWLIVYAVVGVVAVILAWPIMEKAETKVLAAVFCIVTAAWIAAFIHLSNSRAPNIWWWLAATIGLSFGSSYAALEIGRMPDGSRIGMFVFSALVSALAVFVAWRRKGEGHAV